MDRMVRCNHCMNIFTEEMLDEQTKPGEKEKCPVCGKSDALMDL